MKIPQNNQWTQTNTGNILGTLNSTHNMQFDAQGQATLSKKAISLADSTTTDFSEVMAIVFFDGNYFIITDDKVFEGDLSNNAFTAVTSSPSLGIVSDAVVCFSRLYVSDTTSIAYHTGSSWTTGIGTLTSSYPHPLAVFDSQTTYKLAVGDGNAVKLYDSSGNLYSTTLSLPTNYLVTSMAYRNGYLYIATKEINGGEAAIFMWNGDGTNAQYKIDVGAGWIYSITPYRGTVACVTSEGEILAVDGTAIARLAAFPVFHASGARWEQGNATRGKVYPRGMVALGDNLFINASGRVDAGECPQMRSGVWCFDPDIGLYHYASPSTDRWVEDADVTVSDSVLTTAATHGLKLGDVVTFTSVSGISGISNNKKYYAIPVSTTTLKIAGSLQDAYNSNYIVLTGTATTDTINYAPNTDFGEASQADSGAIAITNYLDSPNPLFESDIIFGSELEKEDGTELDVLCVLSPRFNIGSLTTQKIYTDNVGETWKSLYTYISGLLGSNEKAIIRYQVEEKHSFPTPDVSGTWIGTTTFVTTDPVVRNIISEGDLMEIRKGYGQGQYAEVSAVEHSATTTSITVNRDVGTDAGTSVARFSNFITAGEITSSRIETDIKRVTFDKKNSWIKVMVELQGFEPSVTMFELSHSVAENAV